MKEFTAIGTAFPLTETGYKKLDSVRTTDGKGTVQSSKNLRTEPKGAAGWHTINFTLSSSESLHRVPSTHTGVQ